MNHTHPVAWIFFDWVESDDQIPVSTTSFTAERDFLSEDPVLFLDMPEVRNHICFPQGFGNHKFLLLLETRMTSRVFESDMQLDKGV